LTKRQVEVRRQRQQNVDVVDFAVELDQFATPIPALLFRKDAPASAL